MVFLCEALEGPGWHSPGNAIFLPNTIQKIAKVGI